MYYLNTIFSFSQDPDIGMNFNKLRSLKKWNMKNGRNTDASARTHTRK